MEKVKFKCYLCGEEAEKFSAPDTRKEIVECKGACVNRYSVTDAALRYCLDRKEGSEVLTEEDRFKLSEYVYNHIVPIDSKVIEKVTGKKSVGYR